MSKSTSQVEGLSKFFSREPEKLDDSVIARITEFRRRLINFSSCILCKESFTLDSVNLPRILIHCGHTFCTECLSSLLKNKRVRCPLCLKLVKNIKKIERLPLNHDIVRSIIKQINIEAKINKDSQGRNSPSEPIDPEDFLLDAFRRASRGMKKQKKLEEQEIVYLQNCQQHEDRIEHFFCINHKESCCRICCEKQHFGPKCDVIDLDEVEDVSAFLKNYLKNEDEDSQPDLSEYEDDDEEEDSEDEEYEDDSQSSSSRY